MSRASPAASARPTTGVAQQQGEAADREAAAGLTALRGPGVTVRMDDAPRRPDGTRPANASADDLVVHQQDVQAVVNALWAGGAEAMMIMGVRIIATSAVRCVGNTLLLDGRVHSPPFVITAIGDPGRLQRALDESAGVRLFRNAAADFGLGYEARVEGDVTVPAYHGSLASARCEGAGMTPSQPAHRPPHRPAHAAPPEPRRGRGRQRADVGAAGAPAAPDPVPTSSTAPTTPPAGEPA